MELLFTKNNSIMSNVIRKVTGEPVSHVVIATPTVVVHSNLYGVLAQSRESFERHSEVVYRVPVTPDHERLLSLFVKYQRSWYDVGGMLFLGIALLLRRAGIYRYKVNLWSHSGMFLCTEWVTKYLEGAEDSMITPYQLYLRLQARS